MRKLIREVLLSVLINALILWGLSHYHFGLLIEANAEPTQAFLILGFVFWIVNFVLKKVIHIVSFPLRLLTLGLFSVVINVGVLYFFQWFINTNYQEVAHITLASPRIKVFVLSLVISFAYALLSKLLK